MVPVKLKLSNFTSYGEDIPELNFTKFHLAVISGTNGVGKSSILDAVTWCVWGWSRAGDSADQLIRLGQNEMLVEFTFELDNHTYTVKRRRSSKSGGSTALEFWSNSHNLTEGTIKTTQQKIINTLHLTYETFTNSSFLRQGHADEFTTRGPTDRKRILADILGLDHYDLLEEKAKLKAKDAQTKIQLMDYQLLELEAELSQKEEREKNLTLVQKEEEETKGQLKIAEAEVKEVELNQKEAEGEVNLLQSQKEKYQNLKKELVELKTQIDLKNLAQKEYQQILERKEEIIKNYQRFLLLQEQKQALEEKRTTLIKVKDELVILEKTIREREEKRSQYINKEEVAIKELQTKKESLEKQNSQLRESRDHCPTCGQIINQEKNAQIIDQNQTKINQYQQAVLTHQETIKKYKEAKFAEYDQKESQEKIRIELEEQTKDYNQISEEFKKLQPVLEENNKLQQAEVAVKTHQEAIADLNKIYQAKEKELKEEESIAQLLDKKLSALKEVQQLLLAKQEILKALQQKLLELSGKLGEAKQLVSRAKQLEELHLQKKHDKEVLQKEREAFEELALAFGKKGIQAMIIETAIPEIEDEANRLLDRLSEGRMKVSFETQKETKTKVATGLGTKERATIETLDIIISDEMGERAYEMYSGGEAFRANFAIRLALSKLLTRRAGAKLQFLIIDEGFGTQDAQGKTRIVEVLDTIKNDFEKILVITHLEELKEEFPTRIEVSKNSHGSTFEVVSS